jgi:micrococcal nuclease
MHSRSLAPLAIALVMLSQLLPLLHEQPALAYASRYHRKELTPSSISTHGTVISITDGDTLTVACDGIPEKIRLVDVDAPEKSQPFGRAAKKYLSDLAYMHEVTVSRRGHDRYGRTLATVSLADDGSTSKHATTLHPADADSLHESVNASLLAAGYAWVYRGKAQDPQFRTLEASARIAHRGLWADASAIAPWDYRKQAKLHTVTRQNDPDALVRELLHERWRKPQKGVITK